MNTLFSQLTTSILRKIVGNSSAYSSNLQWKTNLIKYPVSIKPLKLGLPTFGGIQSCYYSTKKASSTRKPRKSKVEDDKGSTTRKPRKPKVETSMKDEEKDAFFVVRKGDVVGVYKSLSDCQSQVGSSICDPPVSVYKGYSLPKEAEEHLISRGLQNALYTIKASDLDEDLFGKLAPCPFQEPGPSIGETSSIDLSQKRPHDMLDSESLDGDGLPLTSIAPSKKLQKLDKRPCDEPCIMEFDGASKGNPGPAGAGAILRTPNGSLICKIRQGLGTATNNAAEYQAIILGLKKAHEMGYTRIQAKGDSKLVCMQVQGLWKVKNQNLADLHAEATKLKKKFTSFKISHILREYNQDADEQANMGVSLPDGESQENLCV